MLLIECHRIDCCHDNLEISVDWWKFRSKSSDNEGGEVDNVGLRSKKCLSCC